jgi:type IV pilus assembly protein PilO
MQLSLNKMSWKVQVAFFVTIAVAAAGAFYYLRAMPAGEAMQVQQRELNGLQARIDKGRATARRLPDFQRQVAELQGRLDNLKAVLPEQKDVGDLLRRLQTLAVQSNLQIKGFKPAPIVTKQMHAEWPINLEIEGTYHRLGEFFDRVSKFSRIININAVTIRAKDKPQDATTIEARCVATTFVLIDAPPPVVGKPGAKGAKPAAAKAD